MKLRVRLPSSPVTFLVATLAFRMVLDTTYVVYIYPFFSYAGFELEWNLLQYAESWLLFAVVSISLPQILKRPSDLFMLILGLGLLAPMTSMYGLAGEPRWIIYSIVTGFFVIWITRRGRKLRIPTLKGGPRLALFISWAMTILVLGWLMASGGLSYLNFDLTQVYEFRRDAGAVIDQGIFGYLNNWVFKVFNIFLFAYALHQRSWILACLIFGLQMLFFGISAHKSVLFYPILVLAVWYYFRSVRTLAVIPTGLIVVASISVMLWIFAGDHFTLSLFIRRVFFITAQAAYGYYHFFSENQHVYWSNSVTSAVIDYPYHLNPAYLIGEWLGTGSHANNTFMATGYMHAGIAGLLFYCLILGWLFRLIDSLATHGVPEWLAIAVTVVPMFSLLLSADLPTALLTHGIALSMILLFLVRTSVFDRRQVAAASIRRRSDGNKIVGRITDKVCP